MVKQKPRTTRLSGLAVRQQTMKSRMAPLINVNPLRGKRTVSIRKGLEVPKYVKDYMSTFTSAQQAEIALGQTTEIAEHYEGLVFDKNTMKLVRSRNPIDETTTKVLEYAVRTNLNSMIPFNRRFVKSHWNGRMYITIKKLARTGSYTIPWHRDALAMMIEGVAHKVFCVGAIYVNKPNLPGGRIEFARGTARFGIAPPSGTSVTFFDDEIFHRVTPVQAPGLTYVPRTAIFMGFGTNEKGPFKVGLSEAVIGGRNYETFFRTKIPRPNARMLNKNVSQFTNNNKLRGTQLAQEFFRRQNVNYTNFKTIYNDMKKTFGHSVYERPEIKALLNKNTLTNQEKATLNAFAKQYFAQNIATNANLKSLYNYVKRESGGQIGVKQNNKSFVVNVKRRRRQVPGIGKRTLQFLKTSPSTSSSRRSSPSSSNTNASLSTQLNRIMQQLSPSSSRRSSNTSTYNQFNIILQKRRPSSSRRSSPVLPPLRPSSAGTTGTMPNLNALLNQVLARRPRSV